MEKSEKNAEVKPDCLLYGCEYFRYDEASNKESCVADEETDELPCAEEEAD